MKFYDLESKYKYQESEEEILKALDECDETCVDGSKNTALHLAALYGDVDGVTHLLDKGWNANTNNEYNENPLFSLADLDDRYRDFDSTKIKGCAEALLDHKASVLKRSDNNGETVITQACKNGRWEIIEACIEKGCKITMTNKNGDTPLHCVASGSKNAMDGLKYAREDTKAKAQKKVDDYLACARLLVEAGLDPTEKNSSNQTAIESAIAAGNKALAAFLSGEEDHAAAGGMNYWQALDAKDLEAIAAIGGDVNAVSDQGKYVGFTPLQWACRNLYSDGVKALLEAGADPNAKNSDGGSAMGALVSYEAGMKNNGAIFQNKEVEKILTALEAKGCDFNDTINDEGDSSLIGACQAGGPGTRSVRNTFYGLIIQWLLDHNADPNKVNLKGQTALMVLGKNQDDALNVYTSLLEQGAEVSAVDKQGNTALHYVATNTDKSLAKEMADMLFTFDFASTEAVNNDGKTALELATEQDNEPLVKMILEHM